MEKCVNCGAKLTVFNDTYPFIEGDSERFCLKCRSKIDDMLLRHDMHMEDLRLTHDFIEGHASELQLEPEGLAYLHRYVDHLAQSFSDEELEAAEQQSAEAMKAENERRKERQEQEEREDAEKNRAMASMLISSGFNFEGYRIVKYSGYISGDDAVQIPRSGVFDRGRNGQNLTEALVRIRRVALQELKQAAYDLGCNAVIGVDFDYLTLDPQTATITGGTLYEPYVICVTANGNAVVIEKIED